MKTLKIYLFFIFYLLLSNNTFCSQYTEEDKQLFYDAFINSYINEMQRIVENLNVEQTKKDLFMQNLKNNIDRDYLIKSSWDCIQKFPVESIVKASILCTSTWNKKQSEKTKNYFEELKN